MAPLTLALLSFISYTYRLTVMAKRKNLDDFQILTRGFFNLIRANHHLEKVQRGPTELPAPKFLKEVKKWLSKTPKQTSKPK